MKAVEIYDVLCQCRDPKAEGGKTPMQLKQEGVKMSEIDDDEMDVISHTKYEGEDGGIVEEMFISYDHSRTFEHRPDPNHFYITLYDKKGNKIKGSHYMQMDTM